MPSTASSIVAIALLAALCLVWFAKSLASRPFARNITLAGLAALALLVHVDFFRYHGERGAVHWWEFYHYYVGTKYFSEVGYDHLYEATVVADFEDDPERAPSLRMIRSMKNYRLEARASVMKRAASIRAPFSDERWRAFKADVAVFRAAAPQAWYASVPLQDHGINATPVNVALLSVLSNGLQVGAHTFCTWFAWADLALILLCTAMLQRQLGAPLALGWLIFWALNPLNGYAMIGGAYLRHAYLILLVLGAGALLRGRNVIAGVLVGASSSLTLLPAVLGVAYLGGLQFEDWRRAVRFGAALALALGSLFVISAVTVEPPDGRDAWRAFQEKISLHANKPSLNQVGLGYAIGFSDAHNARLVTESWPHGRKLVWPEEMARTRQERALLYRALQGAAIVLAVSTMAYAAAPLGAAAGLLLLYALVDVSAYYYAMLCLLPLMAALRRVHMISLAAGFSCIWAAGLIPQIHGVVDRYFFVASVVVGLMLATICLLALIEGWRAEQQVPRA